MDYKQKIAKATSWSFLTQIIAKSYKLMKNSYKNAKVILCPDIVLSLDLDDIIKNMNDRSYVGICIRDDEEGILSAEEKTAILNKFSNPLLLTTMCLTGERIDERNREKIVYEKLQEFARCKLVITDRLHGMIFSYITNTPCIALPNSNGKVKGVSTWIKNKGTIRYVENISDIQLCDENCHNRKLESEYSELAFTIKNAVNYRGEK